MITLEHVYIMTGIMFAAFAIGRALDRSSARRWRSAAFWGIYALSFLAGSHLPDLANGMILMALVVLAASGLASADAAAPVAERREAAQRNGNRLFVPALAIPVVVLLVTVFGKKLHIGSAALLDPAHTTLIALALAVLVALALGCALLRAPLLAPLREGRRLMEAVGWAAVLPQTLASLGALFAAAGVGRVVGQLVTQAIPMTNGSIAVVTYTLGMLSGFCGTLMTPMAANFNIVPAALLELPDRNGVIKVQIPTAVLLLAANTALMALCVYRR